MKNICILILGMIGLLQFTSCESTDETINYSGTYCLNIQNIEMILIQDSDNVTFSLQNDLLINGKGAILGDTMILTANTPQSELFDSEVIFSDDGQHFSGPFEIKDLAGNIMMQGDLLGEKGSCSKYDLMTNGIPKFVGHDFTQIAKIEQVSKFRSGFGHSFTDGTETCRSMKQYYSPYTNYRMNNTVEIYSPVDGMIISVSSDGFGVSYGLKNKQIHIKPEEQPAFTLQLFHCYLASSSIVTGKKVKAGELLGYARLYYDDLEEYSTSFDIAVWVNTPGGMRLLPYFETMSDEVFGQYISTNLNSRADFIISREDRDADPLTCEGDSFLNDGNLVNWVILAQ